MSEPFATPDDLADRWRLLSDVEMRRASVLLDDASRIIRRRFPDVDTRPDLELDDLTMIVCAMVKRAMFTADIPGVSATTEAAGPFNVQRTYVNPTGDLYLSAGDLAVLDPGDKGDGRRAFVIDLTPVRPI